MEKGCVCVNFFVVIHALEWPLIKPTNVGIITLRMCSELFTNSQNKTIFVNLLEYIVIGNMIEKHTFEFTYSLRNKRSRITKAFLHSDRARVGTIAKKSLFCLSICCRSKLRTFKMRETPFVRERLLCRLA